MKKFLLAVLFLSAFPGITMAQTTTCIDLKNNLLRGAKNANTNNEVIVLQNFLKARGFLYATPNGSFGPATLSAVKKFQSNAGIGSQGTPGYGGIGPKSRAKIKEMTCGVSTTITTNHPTTNASTVSECLPGYSFNTVTGKSCVTGATTAVTQATQTNTSLQNQPATYQLQSAFFRNDANAQKILEGKTIPINMDGSVSATSLEWKFLNGLRQVGYTGNSSLLPSTGMHLLEWVHKFQQLNNLTQRNEIAATELMKLDTLVFAMEASDSRLAASFPLTDTVVGGSSSEPSSTHVKALFVLALQALPTSLAQWNNENMSDYIRTQGSGGDALGWQYRPQGICFMTYFPSMNSECNQTFTTSTIAGLLKEDTSLVANILHEYAHYIDGYVHPASLGSVTSKGIINTNGFRAISYDTSNNCNIGSPSENWGFFKLRNPGNERNEFVTNYAALSWWKTGDESCKSSSEDFAESFTMYVMQGNTFRKLAETKPVIAQKYAWLKNNVFGGKEYYTGNPQNIPLLNQALAAPYSQLLPSFIDYFTINPDFVFGYQI